MDKNKGYTEKDNEYMERNSNIVDFSHEKPIF